MRFLILLQTMDVGIPFPYPTLLRPTDPAWCLLYYSLERRSRALQEGVEKQLSVPRRGTHNAEQALRMMPIPGHGSLGATSGASALWPLLAGDFFHTLLQPLG